MKVIVDGLIIETGFILTIKKKWITEDGMAGYNYMRLDLEINTVFGQKIVINGKYCTNDFYKQPDSQALELMKKLETRADRIIEFLEKHSSKMSLPYPVFEDE